MNDSNWKKYQQDAEAAKFFKENPEFNDQYVEQREVHYDDHQGSHTKVEPDPNDYRVAKAQYLRDALHYYPDSYTKEVMTMYYANATISEIHEFMGVRKRSAVFEFVSRAKKRIDKWFKQRNSRRIDTKNCVTLAKKRLIYDGEERIIFLRWDTVEEDYVWTHSNGWVLDVVVQKMLDEEEEFSHWDDVLIDKIVEK